MARNENDARWPGLGTFVVWAPSSRDKVDHFAALARCLRRLFANTGEKALATRKALRVASWLTFTNGEKDTMKDHNGNEAFVHIGGVTYISAAHLATSMTECQPGQAGWVLRGRQRNGNLEQSWSVWPSGEYELKSRTIDGPEFSYSTNTPYVEAFLEAKKVGELKYDLKIDTSEVTAALEQLSRIIGDTKLVKSLKEISAEQQENLRKAVQDAIEKESRQGGALWSAGVANVTLRGAQVAPPVKSLDELADEFLAPYLRDATVTDSAIREAYRLANLRLSLRAQYKAT